MGTALTLPPNGTAIMPPSLERLISEWRADAPEYLPTPTEAQHAAIPATLDRLKASLGPAAPEALAVEIAHVLGMCRTMGLQFDAKGAELLAKSYRDALASYPGDLALQALRDIRKSYRYWNRPPAPADITALATGAAVERRRQILLLERIGAQQPARPRKPLTDDERKQASAALAKAHEALNANTVAMRAKRVEPEDEAQPVARRAPRPLPPIAAPRVQPALTCSFCGRGTDAVDLMVSGMSGCICDRCAETTWAMVQERRAAKPVPPAEALAFLEDGNGSA